MTKIDRKVHVRVYLLFFFFARDLRAESSPVKAAKLPHAKKGAWERQRSGRMQKKDVNKHIKSFNKIHLWKWNSTKFLRAALTSQVWQTKCLRKLSLRDTDACFRDAGAKIFDKKGAWTRILRLKKRERISRLKKTKTTGYIPNYFFFPKTLFSGRSSKMFAKIFFLTHFFFSFSFTIFF